MSEDRRVLSFSYFTSTRLDGFLETAFETVLSDTFPSFEFSVYLEKGLLTIDVEDLYGEEVGTLSYKPMSAKAPKLHEILRDVQEAIDAYRVVSD